jgi:hypothetical protein
VICERGCGTAVDLTVTSHRSPLRLPLRALLDHDSVQSFAGDSIVRPASGGMSLALYQASNFDKLEGYEAALGVWDTYRTPFWNLVRTPGDSVAGGIIRRGETTAPRGIFFSTTLAAPFDSLRFEVRIQGTPPAAAIPATIPVLDIPRHLASSGVVRDTAVFPRPFYDGIVVLGFYAYATPLVRQLVFDRLGGEVIAQRLRGDSAPDLIVRVGVAWRDSLNRGMGKLSSQISRFGILPVPGAAPLVAAREPRPVNGKVMEHHLMEGEPSDTLVHRRMVLVLLAGASRSEREEIAAIARGRWIRREEGFMAFLELVGTRRDVERRLNFIKRLPQVDGGILNYVLTGLTR